MTTLDLILLAAAALLGGPIVLPYIKPLLGKLLQPQPAAPPTGTHPPTPDDRLSCLAAILAAVDLAKEHGHQDLVEQLEQAYPTAANCLRTKAPTSDE